MKTLFKILFVLSLCLGISSCNKEPVPVAPNSELLLNEGSRISRFSLHEKLIALKNGGEVLVRLRNIRTGAVLQCITRVEREGEKLHIYMTIPENEHIEDGDYHLVLSDKLKGRLANRLRVHFSGEKLVSAHIDEPVLSLSGDGSSMSNPFLVKNQSQFGEMLQMLSKDEGHGFGLYFKLAGSFTVPLRGRDQQGSFYYPQEFAGTFFGNGKETITVQYSGASRSGYDDYVGLFSILHEGTYISDININFNAVGINCGGGAVAGKTSGSVKIENVNVSGSISQSNNYIGGLVGYATGNLTIFNCVVGMTLSSWDFIGGAVGYFNGTSLNISSLCNIGSNGILNFSVSGHNYIGGVIGMLDYGDCDISNVEFRCISDDWLHSDMALLRSSYTDLGGVIGNYKAQKLSIKDCLIYLPMQGGYNVGGIAGSFKAVGSKAINIAGVVIGADIKGRQKVGGFFGDFSYRSSNLSSYFTIDKSRYHSSVGTDGNTVSIVAQEGDAGGVFGIFRPEGAYMDDIHFNDPVYCYMKVIANYPRKSYAGFVAGECSYSYFYKEDFSWPESILYPEVVDAGVNMEYRPFGLALMSYFNE